MSKHTPRARSRLTGFGEAVLGFPFKATLVEDIKAGIPYRYRSYDPATKEWTVQPPYADYATALLLEHFPDAEVPPWTRWQRDQRAQPTSWNEGSDHFRVLHLRETAPIELIESAYRTLAKLNHPDLGGDHATMLRLNSAFQALREQVAS